jgi:hypothetical protein
MYVANRKNEVFMRDYYTIDDLATMTMLTTRTLRNYIKQGFIHGDKNDGIWKFTTEDIEILLKNDVVNQSIQSKKNGIVYEYMANDIKKENMVCSIYDFANNTNVAADNICNRMVELVNTNMYGNIKFSYTYNGKTRMVRIILVGAITSISDLMDNFSEM